MVKKHGDGWMDGEVEYTRRQSKCLKERKKKTNGEQKENENEVKLKWKKFCSEDWRWVFGMKRRTERSARNRER